LNKFSVSENLRLGQRVSMLCSATDGDLPMTLTWFRDEQMMLGGLARTPGVDISQIGSYESVLRIDHLRPEHNANFSCIAENPAGRAVHSQTLRVKGTLSRTTLTAAPYLVHAPPTAPTFGVARPLT
jgi:hypothetical protein